jgi:hypothetical protein
MPYDIELADRPARRKKKVEVTPEMIDAAVDVIEGMVVDEWDHRSDRDMAVKIFVAMADMFYPK